MKVKECMCNNVNCMQTKDTVEDCAKLMGEKHIGCVPVCDYNKNIIGLVTDRDVLLRTIACGKDARHTYVGDIMTSNVCCCNQEDEIEHAERKMCNEQVRRLPVIDENNRIVGIITLGDLCQKSDSENTGKTLENICKCNDKNAE